MAGGLLHIDLAALASNWRTLRDNAGGAEASAVVKADAYGTGIEQAVPALHRAGCRTFFVAHVSEAIRVRTVAPDATIYVLNGLFPGTCATYVEHNLRPVLGSFEEIEEWASFCRSQGQKREAAIHVDTGMNRLGLTVEQGLTLKGRNDLKDFETALLMSHFVSAEESDNPLNIRQIDAFNAVRETLPGVRASLANSSGIFLKEKPHFDLVRPGYALYGGNPTPDRDNPMSAVAQLEARIVQLRWVEEDDTVGYNARWLALGRRRIATLSIGYADGYPRSASARGKSGEELLAGQVLVAGRPCPFAGNVSMDLITVDVTDIPDNEIKRGDTVTMIGGALTIDEVGRRAGTIGYEILTSLGRRYARSYTGTQG
ncbi:alanine racemase [Microvirga solisilvae]|uniref:alanine racemase n=1 Tax=Microvirga solisilvae TaxID=2919498 RepID=UPI001FAF71C7|nr:alanine racemase [Microvirga solisilvae]